jgi:hypothetical protein
MLREIPESEAGHNDYERWWFEEQRAEWEEEQREDEKEGSPDHTL